MFEKYIDKYKNLPLSARAAIWFTVCNAVTQGINFLIMPFFTRIMSENEYGIVTTYNSWLSILMAITTLNIYGSTLNNAMIKYDSKRETLLASAYGLIAALSSILLVVMLFGSVVVSNLLKLKFFLALALPIQIFVTSEFTLWTQYKKFNYDYITLTKVTLFYIFIPVLLSITVTALWPYDNDKSVVKTWSQLAGTLPIVLLLGVTILRDNNKLYDREIWCYLLSFSLPLLPHYLSMIVLGQSDRIMIADLCGNREAAYYAVSYQISIASTIVISAVTQAVVPWLYRCLQERRDFTEEKRTITLISIFVAFSTLVLTLFAPEIIAIFAPASYREAMYVIPAISCSTFFTYLYSMCVNIELFYNNKVYTVLITTISAIINIALNFYLIPVFGYQIAGYTTLICYALMGVGHTIASQAISNSNSISIYNFKHLWVIASILLVASYIVMQLYSTILPRYIIAAIIMIITYKYGIKNYKDVVLA